MPVCELCDGESFHDIDGRFYCDDCNTQSQDIQVEFKQEMNKEQMSSDTYKLGLNKSHAKTKRHIKVMDVGKPWVIYEGYQYMIKGIVEALISMGFDKRLKNVVRQIWFHYLKTKKIAFCEEEPEKIILKEHSKRRNFKSNLNRYWKKKHRMIKKEQEELLGESMKDEEDFPKKEFMDEYDRMATSLENTMNSEIDNESSSDNEDSLRNETIGSFKYNCGKSRVFNLKQQHTVAFCYIGLVMLREPVLMSDLIRWSHDGILPYHKAEQVLPQQMKFSSTDFNSFCNRKKLLYQQLSINLTEMLRDLKIKLHLHFDKAYRKLLVATMLADLEFSNCILSVAWYLVDIDLRLPHKYTLPFIDGLIAAYIIVAVKLIYYLDDYHELNDMVRSSLLTKLDLTLNESWKNWVRKSMLKRKRKLYNGIPRYEDDLKYVHDLSVYEDYCIKDAFNSFNIRLAVKKREQFPYMFNKWKKRNIDPRQEYMRPLYSLAQELNPDLSLEHIKRVPSSFPLSVDHLGEVIRCEVHNDVNAKSLPCKPSNLCGENLPAENNYLSCAVDLEERGTFPLEGRPNKDEESNGIHIGKHCETDYVSSCVNGTEFETDANITLPVLEGECAVKIDNLSEIKENRNKHNIYSNDVQNNTELPRDYINYHFDDVNSWHSSYKYIVGIIARRLEMDESGVQYHIKKLERRLFVSMK